MGREGRLLPPHCIRPGPPTNNNTYHTYGPARPVRYSTVQYSIVEYYSTIVPQYRRTVPPPVLGDPAQVLAMVVLLMVVVVVVLFFRLLLLVPRYYCSLLVTRGCWWCREGLGLGAYHLSFYQYSV